MCIMSLKQIIFEYNNSSTPIYDCFLDISKAFDKVNNGKLLNIKKNRDLCDFILELLYTSLKTNFFIRWQGCLSKSFNPTFGLRQGFILSPLFFNIYLEKLSILLNKTPIGCYMNNVFINHSIYV